LGLTWHVLQQSYKHIAQTISRHSKICAMQPINSEAFSSQERAAKQFGNVAFSMKVLQQIEM
jgi:hypothetical protein